MAKRPTPPNDKAYWPPIEEQLAEAKAIPGSAFEKFIRLNQNFELLRQGETHGDTIGFPPWLRVYWRKMHPDESHAPAGPASDYPESLDRIEEWMRANQDLSPDPEEWLRNSERTPKGGRNAD